MLRRASNAAGCTCSWSRWRVIVKAALLMALTLSGSQVVQLAKVVALDNSSSAQAVASQLIAAFGSNPDTLAELQQQASYVLQVLGKPGDTPPGASGTPAATPATPSPVQSAPNPTSTSAAVQMSAAEAAALRAALNQLSSTSPPPLPAQTAAQQLAPVLSRLFATAPAPATSPVASLSDAFTTPASSGLAGMLLQNAGGLSSAPITNTSASVKAASGFNDPLLANAFAPIGSGDNILEFRKRVQAVKEWYREARTYLHIDDAIRIQGYINTLESLGIAFIAAFPIAELALFVANVALAASITSLLGGIFYTAASSVGLTGSIIGLQAALDSAEAARRTAAATAASNAAASASASAADDMAGVDAAVAGRAFAPAPVSTRANSNSNAGTSGILTDVAGSASVSSLINNQDLVNNLVTASQGVNNDILPWVLGGGALAPMSLATDVLGAASDSLNRLSSWTPPANTLGSFGNLFQAGGKRK